MASVTVPSEDDFNALEARVTALENAGKITPTPTPAPSPTPPVTPPTKPAASPDGTSITPTPPGQILIDPAGDVWGFSSIVLPGFGNGIMLNGGAMVGTGATMILLFGGKVYQTNTPGGWWSWNGSNWISTTDPRPQTFPSKGSSPTPPPAAVAAGLTTLAFESGGNTPWKLSGPVGGTGVQWWGDSGWHQPFGGEFSVDSSNILTITDTTGQSSFHTTPYDAHEPGFFIVPPFYVEARLKGGATSFIGFGYQHYRTNVGGHWPELDIVETGEVQAPGITPGNITVHDWVNGAEPVPFANAPWGPPGTTWSSPTSQWADFSQWHVVGALVLPGKAVSGFLDNNVSPSWTDPTYYSAYDTEQFELWIGSWDKLVSQFDYVRVWK